MKYHIWTEGCQMNVADSQRVASALEHLGYQAAHTADEADVIVLNTCVVRQSAEDKAYGRLSSLRPIKKARPDLVINLMGCLVGVKGNTRVAERFPYVDVFSPPSDPAPLVEYLLRRDGHDLQEAETALRYSLQDEELILPVALSPTSAASRKAAHQRKSSARRAHWWLRASKKLLCSGKLSTATVRTCPNTLI
jgi:tRNA-2-methylthio-N6-dimethylallyladenosine synthase